MMVRYPSVDTSLTGGENCEKGSEVQKALVTKLNKKDEGLSAFSDFYHTVLVRSWAWLTP